MRFTKALDWFRLTGGAWGVSRKKRTRAAVPVKRVNSRPDTWPPTDGP